MKKLLPIFSLAIVMAACNSTPNDSVSANTTAPAPVQAPAFNPDTVGLAQFQEWKAQNELAEAKAYQEPVQYAAAVPVKKASKPYKAPVRKAATKAPVASNNEVAAGNSSESVGSGPSNSDVGAVSTETSNEAKVEEKKGWSKAAKGTAIGAGTGAAVGAVIHKKNRVVGGVIGGVVGGAVGYGVGKVLDKKDGRN